MIEQVNQPCAVGHDTLSIINAIFNGFQLLALTILGHYTRLNVNGHAPKLPRRRNWVE